MKPQIVFATGESGSGKDYFIEKIMPVDNCGNPIFNNLASMTVRGMRPGEVHGREYYFVDEETFYETPRATTLFVNELFWKAKKNNYEILKEQRPDEQLAYAKSLVSGEKPLWMDEREFRELKQSPENIMSFMGNNPKWLYGVPESEMQKYRGQHIVYNVIQPKYVWQMINWLDNNFYGEYEYKILWFQTPESNLDTVAARANMNNDKFVRMLNTCQLRDFWRVGLKPDFPVLSTKDEAYYPVDMVKYFNSVAKSVHYSSTVGQTIRVVSSMPQKLKFRLPEDMVLESGFYARKR